MTDTPAIAPGFADLGLREEILRAIAEAGYSQPTAIQAQAIPEVLARRDVVGIAQTGTGKTASFVLPMLNNLASGRARARMPRSLILSPTRELATQTSQNFEVYGKHLNLSMALLIGGVGMGDQEKTLAKGVDVLIATPGRLLDWFNRGKLLLTGVEMMVIDEADRMLDMGFIPDVEEILSKLSNRKQTLLFSATMDKEIRRLAEKFLRDPAEIEVARRASTSAQVHDALVPLGKVEKRKALERLIKAKDVGTAIVFCNRKRDISSITRHLQRQGFNAKDIHGDLDQSQRQATLNAFKAGEVDYLIATDVAARGLDISDMPFVINLDVPHNAEDYVHRIGRTGRAGKEGHAFTFATDAEFKQVAAIEKLIGRSVDRLEVEGISDAGRERESAPNAPVLEPEVEEAKAKRSSAPNGRRKRRPDGEAQVERSTPRARAGVAERPAARERAEGPVAREPADGKARVGRRRETEREAQAVSAFGDHVPAFILQEVVIKPLPLDDDEIREGGIADRIEAEIMQAEALREREDADDGIDDAVAPQPEEREESQARKPAGRRKRKTEAQAQPAEARAQPEATPVDSALGSEAPPVEAAPAPDAPAGDEPVAAQAEEAAPAKPKRAPRKRKPAAKKAEAAPEVEATPAEPVADAPPEAGAAANAEAGAAEQPPAEKPRRRRAPAKKKVAAEAAEGEATPADAEAGAAEPVEKPPAEKPKRKRAPAKKKAAAEAAEGEAAEPAPKPRARRTRAKKTDDAAAGEEQAAEEPKPEDPPVGEAAA